MSSSSISYGHAFVFRLWVGVTADEEVAVDVGAAAEEAGVDESAEAIADGGAFVARWEAIPASFSLAFCLLAALPL
jgi:hypothetical protein